MNLRRELKFVANGSERARLEMWLRLHPARFSRPHPRRRVNSVYFDDGVLSACAENLAGVSERTKVRFRWYGQETLPGRGQLEVKQRRNAFGWKLLFPVEEPLCLPEERWSTSIARLRSALPEQGRAWLLRFPEPVLIGRYTRDYFLSSDGRVRVTLDHGISVFDQRGARFPRSHRAPLADEIVLEVKVARAHRAQADQVIQGLPIRVSRSSKYVAGVRAITGI